MPCRVAEELGVGARPAQVQVCRMLPGEADTAMHLDGGRGHRDERIRAIGLGKSEIRVAVQVGRIGGRLASSARP